MLLIFFGKWSFAESTNWNAVENVFGKRGTIIGDVLKVSFPRYGLKVKLGGISIEPGLTSWIAFQSMGDKTMIMGDLVLLDQEVGPVISKLAAGGIEVTALHNHLIDESPRVMYLHFLGQGDAVILAQKMKSALEATKTPFGDRLQPHHVFDWSKTESVLGRKGKSNGDLFQVLVPRAETIMESGMDLPPSMGLASGNGNRNYSGLNLNKVK